jgi:hypothetical protein
MHATQWGGAAANQEHRESRRGHRWREEARRGLDLQDIRSSDTRQEKEEESGIKGLKQRQRRQGTGQEKKQVAEYSAAMVSTPEPNGVSRLPPYNAATQTQRCIILPAEMQHFSLNSLGPGNTASLGCSIHNNNDTTDQQQQHYRWRRNGTKQHSSIT